MDFLERRSLKRGALDRLGSINIPDTVGTVDSRTEIPRCVVIMTWAPTQDRMQRRYRR